MGILDKILKRIKKGSSLQREPFLVIPTRLSLSSSEKSEKCEECMKRNEELALNIFDCDEECDSDNEEYVLTKVRFSIYAIEEYFPMNEKETWIKVDGRFGKYIINSEKLDNMLAEYFLFIK